jgi:hypothetical protein
LDVFQLQEALQHQGYQVITLLDEAATTSRVLTSLNSAALNADTLLFYFSGNDAQIRGTDYLATWESTADIAGTGLPWASVDDRMRTVEHGLSFVDLARSDGTPGLSRERNAFASRSNAFVLFAEQPDGADSSYLGQSPFSYLLARGISGAAAGDDGWTTLADLTDFIADAIVSIGAGRTPRFAGRPTGNTLIGERMPDTDRPRTRSQEVESAQPNYDQVEIFYATDRKLGNPVTPNSYFGAERMPISGRDVAPFRHRALPGYYSARPHHRLP